MAKVKTIFARDEISHVWVYGKYRTSSGYVTVTEGRTASYNGHNGHVAGNQSFKDDKFYSYSSQIAQRYDLGEQGILYLVYTGHNSHTTKAQVGMLWNAIPKELGERKVSKFEFSHDSRGYRYWPKDAQDTDIFSRVYAYLYSQAEDKLTKASRARNSRQWLRDQAKQSLNKAIEFAQLMGLAHSTATDELHARINSLPDYTPAPPNPNKRQYIRQWDKAYELVPNLPMIFVRAARGETYELDQLGIKVEKGRIVYPVDEIFGRKCTISLALRDSPWATIRVIGEQVVTSLGVRLGKDEAIKLYEAMLGVVAKLDKNYHQPFVQAGGYSVQYHNGYSWKGDICNKTIRVGCHYFHPTTLASDFLRLLNATKDSDNNYYIS